MIETKKKDNFSALEYQKDNLDNGQCYSVSVAITVFKRPNSKTILMTKKMVLGVIVYNII